jgi:hypothetical protein
MAPSAGGDYTGSACRRHCRDRRHHDKLFILLYLLARDGGAGYRRLLGRGGSWKQNRPSSLQKKLSIFRIGDSIAQFGCGMVARYAVSRRSRRVVSYVDPESRICI